MTRAMLERLEIENYGCIKKAEFKLSPLHALIGPNDSGKSTTLRALRTLSLLAEANADALGAAEAHRLRDALVANAESQPVTLTAKAGNKSWRVQVTGPGMIVEYVFQGLQPAGNPSNPDRLTFERGSGLVRHDRDLAGALVSSQVIRLDADALRKPSGLIPDGQPMRLDNERGGGLPGVYDAIQNRDSEAFSLINEGLRRLFPVVQKLSLKNPASNLKALGVQLQDGTFVGADYMSEGLLYYLAFAAMEHVETTALLLIEEPENGLHPARIADVMRVLREISKTTQVIIATHSPLVINELERDEVSVVTRTAAAGTQVTPIKDTADFGERSKVYSLGELWLSYADGNEEFALLNGGPRP